MADVLDHAPTAGTGSSGARDRVSGATVAVAKPQYLNLIKFLLGSALFFIVGTLQGVIQLLPPIREWLDAVGSPIAGPGHMIDPLAHAHINLVGGVVILGMATTYYLLQEISGRPLWSRRLVGHSFWWTAVGSSLFYVSLITFGVVEGNLLLNDPDSLAGVHRYYAPVISSVATVLAVGFWVFLVNVAMTVRAIYRGL